MGKRKTVEEVINAFKVVHGDCYTYLKVIYKNTDTPVIVTCPVHGDFSITPYRHIQRKQGCPKCGIIKCAESKRKNFMLRGDIINQPEGYKLVRVGNSNVAKVSNEDFEKVKNFIWSFSHGYAYNSSVGRMHRFILGVEEGVCVDHANMDKLDNRRQNIRACTQQQNLFNSRRKLEGKSSKFKGVYYSKRKEKWISDITFSGKKRRVGTFTREEEAARAYDKKAKELFGEFAYLNFPENN